MVTFDEFAVSLRVARANRTHRDRILFTELGGFLVHFHGARQRLARIVTAGSIHDF
jgi:hypothetical protein